MGESFLKRIMGLVTTKPPIEPPPPAWPNQSNWWLHTFTYRFTDISQDVLIGPSERKHTKAYFPYLTEVKGMPYVSADRR